MIPYCILHRGLQCTVSHLRRIEGSSPSLFSGLEMNPNQYQRYESYLVASHMTSADDWLDQRLSGITELGQRRSTYARGGSCEACQVAVSCRSFHKLTKRHSQIRRPPVHLHPAVQRTPRNDEFDTSLCPARGGRGVLELVLLLLQARGAPMAGERPEHGENEDAPIATAR